jgi:hypothetical protein
MPRDDQGRNLKICLIFWIRANEEGTTVILGYNKQHALRGFREVHPGRVVVAVRVGR